MIFIHKRCPTQKLKEQSANNKKNFFFAVSVILRMVVNLMTGSS